jgi:hypothetical protein
VTLTRASDLDPRSRSRRRARGATGGLDPGETFAFSDLMRSAGGRTRPSELMDWLAAALASGRVETVGFTEEDDGRPAGPRRYRVR